MANLKYDGSGFKIIHDVIDNELEFLLAYDDGTLLDGKESYRIIKRHITQALELTVMGD